MAQFILIIDDSVCVRRILDVTLRKAGYDTRSFAEGYEALRWLASEEARIPTLIILDLTMPKMDGYTVLRHLRKRLATAQTPVIILSGRTGVMDRLKGRLAGACVYLTKPFRQQTILDVVRAQLASPDAAPVALTQGAARPPQPTAPVRAPVRPITLQRWED
ncbi:MAG: response regulator [Ktedonobacteraceae bacterium]